ncbi:hypothetical protein AB0M49_36215, partial [Streptomyces sp. NPDC051577]
PRRSHACDPPGPRIRQTRQPRRHAGKFTMPTLIGDLKEQREAVRVKLPLLHYAPACEQSDAMREIARRIAV